MFYRIKKKMQKRYFDIKARSVLDTDPVKRKDLPCVIASNLRHDDLIMYLVAIKSTYPKIGGGDILIIDDGSLTEDDKRILDHHLGNPEIRDFSTVDTGSCPDYIAWRGLRCMIEESQSRYVVKMDSDIVALGPLDEVGRCRDDNRCFVLNSYDCDEVWSAAETAERAKQRESAHVQIQAERKFIDFPDGASLRYIRGCSGFAGFAKGAYDWPAVEKFSKTIADHIGWDTWRSWGSEQVTVNFLVANSNDPLVLPKPKYMNHRLDLDISEAALIHFLGTHRFGSGRYVQAAKRALQSGVA